eukprot:430715-Alexandrium_andersonii.AAC.1
MALRGNSKFLWITRQMHGSRCGRLKGVGPQKTEASLAESEMATQLMPPDPTQCRQAGASMGAPPRVGDGPTVLGAHGIPALPARARGQADG